ncbi:MAG: hypothetical protein JWR14_3640 [Caballeronia sp.]|jgi:hypothetical protein|nr:hypothetical protein [Caballeronia sp.]
MDSNGRPLTTAPIEAGGNRSSVESRDASAKSTRDCGNRRRRSRAKSGPLSISVSSVSVKPRPKSAFVKTPVPGPSSRTGLSHGSMSRVISCPSASPDGATAETLNGSESHDRKKCRKSEFEVLYVMDRFVSCLDSLPEVTVRREVYGAVRRSCKDVSSTRASSGEINRVLRIPAFRVREKCDVRLIPLMTTARPHCVAPTWRNASAAARLRCWIAICNAVTPRASS